MTKKPEWADEFEAMIREVFAMRERGETPPPVETIEDACRLIIAAFPESAAEGGFIAKDYENAVADMDPTAVVAAMWCFVTGKVPGQSLRWAPTPQQFAKIATTGPSDLVGGWTPIAAAASLMKDATPYRKPTLLN